MKFPRIVGCFCFFAAACGGGGSNHGHDAAVDASSNDDSQVVDDGGGVDSGGADATVDSSVPDPDHVTWSRELAGAGEFFTRLDGHALNDVTVTAAGTVIAVGVGGATGLGNGDPYVVRKPLNGDWQEVAPGVTDMLQEVGGQFPLAVASAGSTVVAIGDNPQCGAGSGVWVSDDDGVTWDNDDDGDTLCFAVNTVGRLTSSGGVFVAVGNTLTDPTTEVYTSTDGRAWTKRTLSAKPPTDNTGVNGPTNVEETPWGLATDGLGTVMLVTNVVAFGQMGGDMPGSGRAHVSMDNGLTWNLVTAPPTGNTDPALFSVNYGHGQWVVTDFNNKLYISTDAGQSWTTQDGPTTDAGDDNVVTVRKLVWLRGNAWVAMGEWQDRQTFEGDATAWFSDDDMLTWTRDTSALFAQHGEQQSIGVDIRRATGEIFVVGYDDCGGGLGPDDECDNDSLDGALWLGKY